MDEKFYEEVSREGFLEERAGSRASGGTEAARWGRAGRDARARVSGRQGELLVWGEACGPGQERHGPSPGAGARGCGLCAGQKCGQSRGAGSSPGLPGDVR